MKRAAVITVGAKLESLGALKLASWLRRTGWTVEQKNDLTALDSDLYCFSAVFSWQLPKLVEMVNRAKVCGEVWIGGPAATFSKENFEWVRQQTGIVPHFGLDQRFEREQGKFPMTYFSRGCPAYTPACGLCPVPRLEGTAFTYLRDSNPAPLLLDNNLSALPDDYQDYIIRRYADEWRGPRVDCNSGFEPHSFTEKTYERWKNFPLICWRFGYDDLSEGPQAVEMMKLFQRKGVKGRKVRVYTLIGNEPIDDCLKRIHTVIRFGFWPWPQRLRPLDWREGPLPCRHDWDEQTLIAVQRFYSLGQLWNHVKPEEWKYQSRYPLAAHVEIEEEFKG